MKRSKETKKKHLPRTNTELREKEGKIRAGSVSDGRQRRNICDGITRKREANKPKEIHLPQTNTELHGIRREKNLSVIFANAEIHTNSK